VDPPEVVNANEAIEMQTRKLGPFDSSAIGLGGMCLSHAYGTPPDRQAAAAVLL